MKIKSIKKTGDKLFLVTYETSWGKEKKKFIIQTNDNIKTVLPFSFRDNSGGTFNYVHNDMGETQLKWMVENNVDFFDNDEVL